MLPLRCGCRMDAQYLHLRAQRCGGNHDDVTNPRYNQAANSKAEHVLGRVVNNSPGVSSQSSREVGAE